MSNDIHSRTEMIIGEDGIRRLRDSSAAVFGLGGVGSYVTEALARAGVGRLILCDNDVVSVSNINRQLIALHSTLGMKKTDAARARIADIDPDIKVETYDIFYGEETGDMISFEGVDYIVDAIDSVKSKLFLVERARELGIPVICSMGTGNKLDPTRFEVADISKTSVCPLARVMRTELKKRGISKGVKVVYSKEEPVKTGERTPGSISFVPSACGLIIAGEVIKDLVK